MPINSQQAFFNAAKFRTQREKIRLPHVSLAEMLVAFFRVVLKLLRFRPCTLHNSGNHAVPAMGITGIAIQYLFDSLRVARDTGDVLELLHHQNPHPHAYRTKFTPAPKKPAHTIEFMSTVLLTCLLETTRRDSILTSTIVPAEPGKGTVRLYGWCWRWS